jgi:hypothetical protein
MVSPASDVLCVWGVRRNFSLGLEGVLTEAFGEEYAAYSCLTRLLMPGLLSSQSVG